jgi:Hint module
VGHIPIKLLRIGDMVKSSNDKYTQVYGFGHLNHQQEGTFLRIGFYTWGSNYTLPQQKELSQGIYVLSFLEISARHLVMIDRMNISYRIPAEDVVVGDMLSGQQIQSIQRVVRRGVYAPLTQSGDIMVSGILTSNYVDLFHGNFPTLLLQRGWDQQILAHILFHPQRYVCSHHLAICKNEMYINGYGILAYVIITSSGVIETLQSLTFSIMSTHH